MRSFREWTLTDLDRTFALSVLDSSPVLEDWLNGQEHISPFEQETLRSFQSLVKAHVFLFVSVQRSSTFLRSGP